MYYSREKAGHDQRKPSHCSPCAVFFQRGPGPCERAGTFQCQLRVIQGDMRRFAAGSISRNSWQPGNDGRGLAEYDTVSEKGAMCAYPLHDLCR